MTLFDEARESPKTTTLAELIRMAHNWPEHDIPISVLVDGIECPLNYRYCTTSGVVFAPPDDEPVQMPVETPLARDAGETQTESQPARSAAWKRDAVLGAVVAGWQRGDPVCDYDIEVATGLRHEHASAHRNGLMLAGRVSLIADDGPTGKRHPLKRKGADGKVRTVSHGPWKTKPNPQVSTGNSRVLVWIPT